jgi:hypothetical protein
MFHLVRERTNERRKKLRTRRGRGGERGGGGRGGGGGGGRGRGNDLALQTPCKVFRRGDNFSDKILRRGEEMRKGKRKEGRKEEG